MAVHRTKDGGLVSGRAPWVERQLDMQRVEPAAGATTRLQVLGGEAAGGTMEKEARDRRPGLRARRATRL